MLKIFRKKIVSKIILWGLLILILPAFVMWGSASMSRSKEKGPKYVGIINNKKVSFEDFYGAFSGVRSQIVLNYFNQPKLIDLLINNKPLIAKLAWDRLIMLSEAKKLKLKVSDKEVIQFIQTHPLFSRNGAFDDRFYSYVLRNNIGLEARAFEEAARENISINKLAAILTKDVLVSDPEIIDAYNKEFAKKKLTYILMDTKKALDKIRVDEAAVKDFYEKNKKDFIMKAKTKGALPDRPATFEEAKGAVESFLKEAEAKKSVMKDTDDIYKKLSERIQDKKEDFVHAASRLGLETKETQFISRGDTLDDLGDVSAIIDASANLKDFEASKPLEIKNGFVIFEISGRQNPDEEKFKKEKDEYSKKVRDIKGNVVMEDWLHKAEEKAKPEIKFEEIDKYYSY